VNSAAQFAASFVCAASAARLIVAASASVASSAPVASIAAFFSATISPIAIIAIPVVVSTIRAVSTASSALAKLVARALAASGVAMLAKGVRELAFRPLAKAVDLGSLERAVGLSLREKRLKVLRETFDGLTGELFSALDVLGSIEPVVRHVVPVQRELFARRLLLAGGELLRDAEHLFVAPRVLARRRQEILDDAMVAPGCEVDVLFVSGRVAVEDRRSA